MRAKRARWWGLAATAALVFSASACSSQSSSTTSSPASASASASSTKITTITIALPAKVSDYGWNQQGVNAANAAGAAIGAKVTVVSDLGYDKTQSLLAQLAQKHPGLLIAHASGYDTAAQQVAQQYKVPVMTYDTATELVPGLVSNITTSGEQGGYLAGILAAKTTKTNTVGIAASASDPNWYRMSGGFAAGVHSIDPKIKVLYAEIGPASYDDSAGGKRVAQTLIAANADVIFGMGDGASFGYLDAISNATAAHKVWYIGDIGSMAPIDNKKVLLSSELWDFTAAFKQALSDIQNGTYGKHGYNLDLSNGGVGLLQTSYIPAAVWSQIQTAQQQIISGQVKIPVTTTLPQVKALLG